MIVDIGKIHLDDSGRVILDDADLGRLASTGVFAGGNDSVNAGTCTNATSCHGDTNGQCTNAMGQCDGATNRTQCKVVER